MALNLSGLHSRGGIRVRIDADTLMKAAGVTPRTVAAVGEKMSVLGAGYALPGAQGRDANQGVSGESERPDTRMGKVATSILDEWEADQRGAARPLNLDFVAQVVANTGFKRAAANRRFWDFVLPNGVLLQPHQRQILVKQALANYPPLAQQSTDLASAHQQMAGFMQGPAATPQLASPASPPAPTTVGLPPAAPGHQTLTGVAQRPIGLDQPQDTRAAALPGTPGHAATNVIDQRGGLDPRGLTVDGNNAAGIRKFGGYTSDDLLAAANSLQADGLRSSAQEDQSADLLEKTARISLPNQKLRADRIIARHTPQRGEGQGETCKAAQLDYGQHGPWFCRTCGMTGTCRCSSHTHGALPLRYVETCGDCPEKSAAVHPFRPVNADPDFIQANQAWHDAEKARIASNRLACENDPDFQAAARELAARIGLGSV